MSKNAFDLADTVFMKLTLTLDKQDEYSDHRMWEVQRILTALKRKDRNLKRQKDEDRRKELEDLEQLLKEERYEQIAQEELLRMQQELRARLESEKQKVELLRLKMPKEKQTPDEGPDETSEEKLNSILDELLKENSRLEVTFSDLSGNNFFRARTPSWLLQSPKSETYY